MSKPALALLLAAIAVVSFPRTSGATNYHEYKSSIYLVRAKEN